MNTLLIYLRTVFMSCPTSSGICFYWSELKHVKIPRISHVLEKLFTKSSSYRLNWAQLGCHSLHLLRSSCLKEVILLRGVLRSTCQRDHKLGFHVSRYKSIFCLSTSIFVTSIEPCQHDGRRYGECRSGHSLRIWFSATWKAQSRERSVQNQLTGPPRKGIFKSAVWLSAAPLLSL